MSRVSGNVATERERKYEIAKCVQLRKAYRAFNFKLLIYRATLPAFEQLISLCARSSVCTASAKIITLVISQHGSIVQSIHRNSRSSLIFKKIRPNDFSCRKTAPNSYTLRIERLFNNTGRQNLTKPQTVFVNTTLPKKIRGYSLHS